MIGWALFLAVIVDYALLSPNCVAGGHPQKMVTRYTTLVFDSAADLETFNRAIHFPAENTFASFFSSGGGGSIRQELSRKVDLLFEKVQLILDMRKRMRRVRIRLFADSEQLQRAYKKIYGRRADVRGWYVYDFNTVFLNVSDVHEGILAHELGHAIIDHFLAVRPPRATAEILARYVDKHLFEEVKHY